MTIHLYKCFPYLLSIVDQMDEHSNGTANGPYVRIRKGKEGDEGLLAHERVHVWQWWRTFGLHSLLYLLSKRYRLKAEVEAYRKQLEYNPEYLNLYATWLSLPEPDGYGLQTICTKERAIALLS